MINSPTTTDRFLFGQAPFRNRFHGFPSNLWGLTWDFNFSSKLFSFPGGWLMVPLVLTNHRSAEMIGDYCIVISLHHGGRGLSRNVEIVMTWPAGQSEASGCAQGPIRGQATCLSQDDEHYCFNNEAYASKINLNRSIFESVHLDRNVYKFKFPEFWVL